MAAYAGLMTSLRENRPASIAGLKVVVCRLSRLRQVDMLTRAGDGLDLPL